MNINADDRRSEVYRRTAIWFIYGSLVLTISVYAGLSAWQSWASRRESYAVGIAFCISIVGATFILRFIYGKNKARIDSVLTGTKKFLWFWTMLPFRGLWYLVQIAFKGLFWALTCLVEYFIPIFIGWLIGEAFHLGLTSWVPIVGCIFAWGALKSFEERQIKIQTKQDEILAELRSLRN